MRLTSEQLLARQKRAPAAQAKPRRLKSTEPSEADILAMILRALRVHPGVANFWRNNSGAATVGEGAARRFVRFGAKGTPDIIGYLVDGRFFGIEVKSRTGRVSPAQAAFIEHARDSGCIVGVARSVSDALAMIPSSYGRLSVDA